MRSTRLVAIVIVAILALTYVTRDGDDGSLVILHSNDTHCHYDDGLGLSTLKALKDSIESKGDAVFVVDAGDFLQGATYDPTAEIGSRVVSILVDGSEVVPEGLYTICTTDYLAKGGDGNTALTGYAYAGVGDNAMALSMYLLRLEVIKESDIQMGRQTAVEVFDAQNSLMEVVEA